ncbi:MAG: M23 family metallopeptidase [Rikenellaceae bacterium]
MNNIIGKISSWWHGLFQRRRLSLNNTRDNHEVWHTHISPVNIMMAFIAIVLILFILTLTLVSYTPVLELLPGYRIEAISSRQKIIDNIIRLDSMERVINDMTLYTDNISLIMDGKTPVVRSTPTIDSISLSKELVAPNSIDSILRQEMEGESRYNLMATNAMSTASMVAPVDGVITGQFDAANGQYGVQIATAASERIMAAQRGVVTLSLWTPKDGYMVQILHSDNQMTIYQNISHVVVDRGDVVKAGEVIGYNDDAELESNGDRAIKFELWIDGRAVNPEEHIIF